MPWICPSCNAETELGYNVCSKCHKPRPGSDSDQGTLKLDDGNPILIVADLATSMVFLIVAELLIPYLMFRFFGVPPILGALIVFAIFGCVVFYLSRLGKSADTD